MTGVLSRRARSSRSTSRPSPRGRPRSSRTRSKRSLASVDWAAAASRTQAAALKRYGIEVHLRPTQGAAENLRLLLDPASGIDLAFLQGGAGEKTRSQADGDALMSLGSLFYEPVWLFYREDAAQRLLKTDTLSSLTQLAGWRFNIGARGSGSVGLMRKM